MQNKLVLPAVFLSVFVGFGLIAKLVHDQQRVYLLKIATASKDGEYYAFSQALADVASRHQPRLRIQVIATAGASENMQLLRQKQVQLAIVQSDTPVATEVEAVAGLFPEVFHVIAAADANIDRLSDLKEHRVALMPEGSGSHDLFWKIGHHYGLTETELDYIAVPADEAHAAFERGEVDVLSRIIALGNPTVQQLMQRTQAKLIPLEQAEALQIALPYLESATIPQGAYGGSPAIPPQTIPVVSVRAILVSHEGVDRNLIYQVTQLLYEYRNELVALNPRAAAISMPNSMQNLGLPLHEGAQNYYNQDKPNFFVEYAELLGLVLSASVLLASGFWQLRYSLMQRQKNRADMYNLEILTLIEQVYKSDSLEELENIRLQLFEILKTVVDDLDLDRISAESFQSFTFPWEVAISTIRHREMILLNLTPPQDSDQS
jgi:TRAP transporter TAXI family solute receptor